MHTLVEYAYCMIVARAGKKGLLWQLRESRVASGARRQMATSPGITEVSIILRAQIPN